MYIGRKQKLKVQFHLSSGSVYCQEWTVSATYTWKHLCERGTCALNSHVTASSPKGCPNPSDVCKFHHLQPLLPLALTKPLQIPCKSYTSATDDRALDWIPLRTKKKKTKTEKNMALTWESACAYEQSLATGPASLRCGKKKAACVCVKGCICWPVCALSQGLGDYVDKRCTWCFRLSFSPPLPPFICLPSPPSPFSCGHFQHLPQTFKRLGHGSD